MSFSSGGEDLGRAVLVLSTDQAAYDKGLAQAKVKADRAGADLQTTMDKRLTSMSRSMGRVGSNLSRELTLPIIGIGAAAVTMGARFDAAMERVHTQSGASQKEVDNLRGKVLELAKTSTQGPVALAESLYRLEGAGFRGAAAMKALKAASDLAAVGNANVEDTTKTLTQVMKPGIKGVGDFQSAVAQINATVGAGDLKLQQLVDALGTGVVTSAKQAGLSFKDVTGVLAVFGDETNNVSGWSAQLATALHFLTNPTMKASGALADIGLKSDQLALDMRKPNGLVTALKDLQGHLDSTFPKGSGHALTIDQENAALDKYRKTMAAAGEPAKKLDSDVAKYRKRLESYGSAAVAQEQALGDIFPGGRGRVLSVLLNQVDLLQQKEKQIAGTSNQFGADVAKTQETTQFKIHQAWSKIQVDAVELGQTLGPDFLKVGEGIANEADKIASAFERLPAGAKQAIITGGLITAGIGPALKVLSIFTGGVGQLLKVEQGAQRLATGQKSLFGGKTASAAASSVERVATMEVGELIAKNMVGAAGVAGTGLTSTAKAEAAKGGGPAETAALKGAVGEDVRQLDLFGAALEEKTGQLQLLPYGEEKSPVARGMVGSPIAKAAPAAETEAAGAGEVGLLSKAGGVLSAGVGVAGMAAVAAPLAIGLYAALHEIFKTKSYGTKIASSLFGDNFGGPAADDLKKQTAKALDALHNDTAMTSRIERTGRFEVKVPVHLTVDQLKGAALAKAEADAHTAGTLVAKTLQAGWNQYRFQSEPIMFTQLKAKMKELPPAAQAAAALSAVKFAEKLEQEGRLTKGSAARMLTGIEGLFPGFEKYLGLSGMAGINEFNKAFDLSTSEQNIKGQLHRISQDFPQVQDAISKTAGGVEDKAAATVKALLRIQSDGTGPMKRKATADLAALRNTTSKDLAAMGADVVAKSKQMASAMGGNTAAGSKQAATNMGNFASNIQKNINSAAISTGQGMNILITNLNKALHEMGQNRLSPIQVASMTMTVGKQAELNRHNAATGGLIQIGRPGERGGDNVPMNVAGTPIRVGRGEKVAVFNASQQRVMDTGAALMGYQGLNGMFSKVKRPHNYAGGGWVRTGATLDPTSGQAPTYSAHGGMSFAELLEAGANAGLRPDLTTLLGEPRSGFGMPMETPIDIRRAGSKKSYQIWKNDVGSGQAGNSHFTIDLHSRISSLIGGVTRGDVEVAKAGTDPNAQVTGGAAGAIGAAFQALTAPRVKGMGTIPTIVQAALNKATAAANKYGQAHQPAASTGGGAGSFNFQNFSGKLPTAVQKALQIATYEVGRHIPYGTGQFGAYYGVDAPSMDCSGFVSTVLNAAGLDPAGHLLTGGLKTWGEPGPGKYITVGVLGADEGPTGHTMMEIANRYFESGGGGGGPHEDQGWSSNFPWKRHPRGLAEGGFLTRGGPDGAKIGRPGHQPTLAQMKADGKTYKKTTTPTSKRKSQLVSAKQLAKAKAKPKLIKQPKLKALLGFSEMDKLDALTTLIGQYQGQQGYLQALNSGGASLEPLVTLADGTTEQVNWGSIGGPSPSGMIDPSTGQVTKGIYDRLAEIGDPGTLDPNKELGIEDVIVNTMLKQLGLAGTTSKDLAAYIRDMTGVVNRETGQVGWLTQAMDLTQPRPASRIAGRLFGNLGSAATPGVGSGFGGRFHYYDPQTPYAKVILDKVQEYRNAQALIDRWETLKGNIPQERKRRDDAITTAIEARRHQIANSSTKATFTGSELLGAAYTELDKQKQDALNGLPSPPPKGWKGDRTTWNAQHARERAGVVSEFDQRKDAVRQDWAKKNLAARLNKSNALFNLGQQERTEKSSVSSYFDGRQTSLGDSITGERTAREGDHTWLSNLRSAISKQLTTARGYLSDATGDVSSIQQSYTSPYSDLAIALKTAQTVSSEPNVPGYLAEIAGLKGTIVPASTTTADSGSSSDNAAALLALQTQMTAQSELAYAVSQAQYGVLQGAIGKLPGFGGTFHQGGVIPGVMGEERMIRALSGEEIIPIGGQTGHTFHVVVQDGAVDSRRIKVIANGEAQKVTRSQSRTAITGARLPGGAGGR